MLVTSVIRSVRLFSRVCPVVSSRIAEENRSPARRLTGARRAILAYFGSTGFCLASWAAAVPSVKHRLDLATGLLGVILLAMAVGALIGMQAAGRLAARFSTRKIAWVSAVVAALLLAGPAAASDAGTLAIALFAYGAMGGVLQVALNAQAVVVERAYGRPIMSSFHAAYSIGGVAGSLVGALILQAGGSDRTLLPTAAVLVALSFALVGRSLSRLSVETDQGTSGATASDAKTRRGAPAVAWLLGALAAMCLLAEGSAVDWSAVRLRELSGPTSGLAALGYAAFSVAMAIGRLFGDSAVARMGRVTVVRSGSLVAAAAFAVIALVPSPAVVVAGWGLAGLGLCCIVPQLFAAAGNLAGAIRALALTTTLGHLGLLAGPPLIGFVATLFGLGNALLIPAVLALLSALVVGLARVPLRRGLPDLRGAVAS